MSHSISSRHKLPHSASPRIGIIGGGIAGSTIAIELSELGLDVTLLEQGPSLVNGPPICHLHSGGNLYREIDDQQCLTLLRQSIATLKRFHHSAYYRPTVIAIPQRDPGDVDQLLPRLNRLQQHYKELVNDDATNKVLGEPSDYYSLYQRQDLERIAQLSTVDNPQTNEQWLIPVAQELDLDKLKFPILLVQEYGLSVFRLAATATLTLDATPNCDIHCHTAVTDISKSANQWQITTSQNSQTKQFEFDYLINACGYRSGSIDDLVSEKRARLVEFKAAYVTHWHSEFKAWPEVIIYGERGTPNGMAQLTPYPGGYFQIHGMTQDITLFDNGLVANSNSSAQPQLDAQFINKLTKHWPEQLIAQRTTSAIDFISEFIPRFSSASLGGKPLFGAQQIPGQDPNLRTADVSFSLENYARCEIVKASSAIDAADSIVADLTRLALFHPNSASPPTHPLTEQQIDKLATQFAIDRDYPIQLATTFK